MENQVDFKILPSDQFNVYSPATRSDKIITYFTLLSKLRGDILAVSSQEDPNNIVSAYYTNVGNTQTLHLVKGDGSEVTASNSFAGTVTSVGVSMPSAFTVTNSPITTSGTIQITGAGTTAEYVRGDGTLATFPDLSGFVPYVGATQNVDLGEYQIKAGQVAFDLTPTGTAGVGIMRWNDQDGTLDLGLLGGNVTLQIGQEQVVRVVNKSGINLTEAGYQAVKITGAQGNRLKVGLAQANNDANSADTIGLVTENIALNAEGFVTSSGLVRNIDTTGALQGETWADGDVIYLSPTTPGAVTKVKPTAPQHTVILGFVVRAHQTQGQIYVKVDNGYELEELHDVAPTPYVNNGVLYRDTATNLWKSATIPTVLGYTPANSTTTISTTAPLSGGGDLSANRTLSISQAGASSDGYLSSTDWNTFNSKQGALTFTAPLVNTGGTVTITQAGASANGYLSSTDWNTFNSKASDSFKTIAVTGQSNVVADSATDTLTFEAGSNIVITTDAASDKIIISAVGGGTGSVTSVDMTVPTGFAISGNPITTSGTLALAFASGYSLPTNASQTNWNTAYNDSITAFAYNTSTGVLTLTQQDAGTLTATVTLQPFTTTNLAEGTNLYFTTARARQSLSAGTGINYDNSTGVITNSAPDQIVSLTAGTGISTSGTYPSFTITNTAPDQTVVLTAGSGIATSGTYPNFTITNSDRGSSQNIFKNIAVAGQSTIVADSNDDTLTVASGTGISLATDAASDTLTITNTAPDKVVVLTAGTGISTSGTYPNFTITNTLPDQTVVLTGAGTTVVTGTYPNFTITSNDQYVGTVTSVATSAPITGGTITTSGTIGITQSGASSDGYLSSTDWNTFNSKISGSGTTNYVAKFTGSNAVGNSSIFDNGNVGIGTSSPASVSGYAALTIDGTNGSFTEYRQNGTALFRIGADISRPFLYGMTNAPMDFYTNTSLRMRITGDGNVGIGTTSPLEKLVVSDGGAAGFEWIPSSGRWYRYNRSTSAYGGIYSEASEFTWSPYGSEAMRINGSGNVGIRTTAPYSNLEITSTNIAWGEGITVNPAPSGYSATFYRVEGTSGSSYTGTWAIGKSSSSEPGGESFQIVKNGLTGSTAYRVDAAQQWKTNGDSIFGYNVGIGTTSPSYKLDVSGTTRSTTFLSESATSTTGLYITSNTAAAGGAIVRFDKVAADRQIYMTFSSDQLYLGVPASNTTIGEVGTKGSVDLRFATDYSERMRITSAGNVGIGTTSPAAKLDVVGVIRYGDNSSSIGALSYGTGVVTLEASSANTHVSIIPSGTGNVGVATLAPSQKLHVSGNIRVTGAYYDSNNEAGTSGQVLSSTGSGTDWITPATTTATSLYDLLPAARVAFNWIGQVVNDTWTTVFSKSSNLLTTGTWMVKMYVSDFATGGGHYTYTYSGVFTWYQDTTNQGGESAASEIYLHRMGHAANASVLYLRTAETTAASSGDGLFQIKGNYSNTSNQTIQFQFVKIF